MSNLIQNILSVDPLIYLFITMLSAFFISMALLLSTALRNLDLNFTVSNEEDVEALDRKRKDQELRRQLLEKTTKIKEKEERLKQLKRKVPIHQVIYSRIVDLLVNTTAGMNLTRLLISVIVIGSIATVIGVIFKGVIGGLTLGMTSILITIMLINVIAVTKQAKKETEILEFMTINQGNYLSAARIDDAFARTKDALKRDSFVYNVLNNFIVNVEKLNMNKVRALENMKEEFGNIPHVDKMIDVIIRAETIDSNMKDPIVGVTEAYRLSVKVLNYLAIALKITTAVFTIEGLYMLIVTITTGLNPQIIEAMKTSKIGNGMQNGCYITFLLVGILLLTMSMRKLRREWL